MKKGVKIGAIALLSIGIATIIGLVIYRKSPAKDKHIQAMIDAGAKSGIDTTGLTIEAIRQEAPNLTVQQALDFVKAMESGDEAKKLKVAQQIGLA